MTSSNARWCLNMRSLNVQKVSFCHWASHLNLDTIICKILVLLPENTAFLLNFAQWSIASTFTLFGNCAHSFNSEENVWKGLQPESNPIEIIAYVISRFSGDDLVTFGGKIVAMFFDETSVTSLLVPVSKHPTNNVQQKLITKDFLNIWHAPFDLFALTNIVTAQ